MTGVVRVIAVGSLSMTLSIPVQAGVGEDWERTHPFTLMALSSNRYNNWDAAEYQAANLNTVLNWERSIPMISDGAAQGLPWIYNVQANPSGWTTALANEVADAYNTDPSGHLGWLAWDEPSRLQMASAGNVLTQLRTNYPGALVFSNARPFGDTAESNWGGPGVPSGWTYEDYLADFASIVQPDIFMYDLYPFTNSGGTQNPFHGAKLVSDAAKAADLPYWVFIQAYGDGVNKRIPSESDVRMETFLHLTYGFSGIAYFTYEDALGPSMVDANGTPWQLYFDIQEMNPEVFNLGERLKRLTHRDTRYIAGTTGGAPNPGPFNTTSWLSFKGNDDPLIRNLEVDTSKPGNDGPGKDGLIGFFNDDDDRRYFMLTNVYHDQPGTGPLTASQAALDFAMQFSWKVKNLVKISRDSGLEIEVPITGGRLETRLPGGTGDLYRYGQVLAPVPVQTLFEDDFESSRDPGYTPGALLSNQNGWTVAGAPELPIATGDPDFSGQFIGQPSGPGSSGTAITNPAGISGGLDPDLIYILGWDWKPDPRSHGSAIGFAGNATSFPFGTDKVRDLQWLATADNDAILLRFEHDNVQEFAELPMLNSYDDPVRLEIIVDGIDNVVYGIFDGAETRRFDITDAAISDIQMIKMFFDHGGQRRFPQTDNISLVIAMPPLLGDANNDGLVTGADLIAVQQGFGTAGRANGILPGDANDDGLVTGADLIGVQENFGNSFAGGSAAVPEPSTTILLALVAVTFSCRRQSDQRGRSYR